MAPTTALSDEALKYVMIVLKNSDAFKPNYHEVALEAGITNANSAQKKFKKYVEQAGYALVNGAVLLPDGGEDSKAPSTPKTPKTTRTKTATPRSSNKKRKLEAVSSAEE